MAMYALVIERFYFLFSLLDQHLEVPASGMRPFIIN